MLLANVPVSARGGDGRLTDLAAICNAPRTGLRAPSEPRLRNHADPLSQQP
jgi:hypothetical protein